MQGGGVGGGGAARGVRRRRPARALAHNRVPRRAPDWAPATDRAPLGTRPGPPAGEPRQRPPRTAAMPPPKPPAAHPPRRTPLDRALDLPAFAAGVFGLYWSLPIAALVGQVQFWRVWGTRDDALGW